MNQRDRVLSVDIFVSLQIRKGPACAFPIRSMARIAIVQIDARPTHSGIPRAQRARRRKGGIRLHGRISIAAPFVVRRRVLLLEDGQPSVEGADGFIFCVDGGHFDDIDAGGDAFPRGGGPVP